MEFEDLEPRSKKPVLKDLAKMSVTDLEEYIATLEAEIARAREAIAAKQSHRSAAEAFFKK